MKKNRINAFILQGICDPESMSILYCFAVLSVYIYIFESVSRLLCNILLDYRLFK